MSGFAQIIEYLLTGKIIDAVCHERLYLELDDADVLQRVNIYLEQMNRRCVPTEQNGGYYAVYINPSSDDKREVKKQFDEFAKTIEPIVRFFVLCKNATDTTLMTGEKVEFGQILTFVNNSPTAKDELTRIVSLVGRSGTGAKNELTSVFDYLEKQGYLRAMNTDKTIFRATAKWELFYEQIRHIGQCHHVIEPTPIATQDTLAF